MKQNISSVIRGRYAPSPSGRLHIGNARTALLAWLQARSAGGTFIMRIEDIDRARCKPELADRMLDDLRWLGLDWDEGPDVDGPSFSYVQSERTHLYEAALEQLRVKGLLYSCYCTRAQLQAAASAPHGLASEGPLYPGTCRYQSEKEKVAQAGGRQPALRFALPDNPVHFNDRILGEQSFPSGAGGDFIVKRSDGMFGYQLAVVVDDAAMGITEVLRGDDLLDSTPRQLLLYEALGLEAPAFAHVPLLYGPDGHRLSKRHGSVTVEAIRDAGTKPEVLVGMLAWWSGLTDRPEPLSARELTAAFALERISRNPVVVEEHELKQLLSN